MALSCSDELWNTTVGIYTAPTLGPTINAARLGIDVGTTNWNAPAAGTGWNPMAMISAASTQGPQTNGMPAAAFPRLTSSPYTVVKAINTWRPDVFGPDQIAECGQNIPAGWGAWEDSPGPCVRADIVNGNFYGISVNYTGSGGANGQYVQNGWVTYKLYRVRNWALDKIIASVTKPGWVMATDWYIFGIQVWGQNPVNLRVFSKAPVECEVQYTAGYDDGSKGIYADYSVSVPTTSMQLPSLPIYYVIGGTEYAFETGDYTGTSFPWDLPKNFTLPPDTGIAPIGSASWIKNNTGRGWTIWEGQDTDANKILSGQPGIYGANLFGMTPPSFSVAKFKAREISDRLTANVISVNQSTGLATIGGYRKSGNIITLS